jgi:DNA-directed RNA polymerase I, II, and III subunit RPABC2
VQLGDQEEDADIDGGRVDSLAPGMTEAQKKAARAVEPSKRVTTRYMTKYEKARVLGTRALQLRFVCSCLFE